MLKGLLEKLGLASREEVIKANKIARRARMAQLAVEEENKRLRRELIDANRELAESVPGESVVFMNNYIKNVEVQLGECKERIDALEKALKIEAKKVESRDALLRELKVSTLRGGVR